jgi:hypothetical protein
MLLAPGGVAAVNAVLREAAVSRRRNGLPVPEAWRSLAWLVQRAAVELEQAGSGGVGVLASAPELASRSAHDEADRWLSTGEAADAVGLSSSYLRRLARGGWPGARPSVEGYQWDPRRLPSAAR